METFLTILCCSCVNVSVDISCIVVGFIGDSKCDGQDTILKMDTFAIIIGFIGIGIALLVIILVCTVFNLDKDESNNKKQAILLCATSCIYFPLAVLGIVIYILASSECKNSSVAKVILAWCIIRMVCGCSGYIQAFQEYFGQIIQDKIDMT
eukprot:436979_1